MLKTFAAFIKRLSADIRGGTLIIFAVAAPILAVLVLGVIDLYRISVVKQQIQDSLDAATLMAARSLASTDQAVDAVGDDAFQELIIKFEVNAPASTFKMGPDDAIIGTASGELKPIIMGLFSGNKLTASAESTVKRAKTSPIELALVLDTTGSMEGQPIEDLKVAAKDLVAKLHDGVTQTGVVKIAVVPFGQYVNVGVSRRNEPWMKVAADYNEAGPASCNWTWGRGGWNWTCTAGPVTEHKFHGCAGSPAYPKNVQDADANRVYPGYLDLKCGAEMTPLTTSKSTVDNAINALTANGNTYIPAGLAWGFNMLSQPKPMVEAAAYDASGQNTQPRKTLVLMTDGENTVTMDHDNGRHDVDPPGKSPAQEANDYTEELCKNIKAQKIEIYTVAYNDPSNKVKKILEGCASTKDHYFDASDATKLKAAFGVIAGNLRNLYISH